MVLSCSDEAARRHPPNLHDRGNGRHRAKRQGPFRVVQSSLQIQSTGKPNLYFVAPLSMPLCLYYCHAAWRARSIDRPTPSRRRVSLRRPEEHLSPYPSGSSRGPNLHLSTTETLDRSRRYHCLATKPRPTPSTTESHLRRRLALARLVPPPISPRGSD